MTYLFLSKAKKNKYNEFIKDFYEILQDSVNENTLIESSKYPLRALRLSRLFKGELCFIYLQKDPAAVVRSFQKPNVEQPPKGFVLANLYYFVSNAYCSIVSLILKNKGFILIKVRYEDLIEDPEQTLIKIGDYLKLDFSDLIMKISKKEPINIGFLFDGNRIRLKPSLILNHKTIKHNSLKDKLSRLINSPFYLTKIK